MIGNRYQYTLHLAMNACTGAVQVLLHHLNVRLQAQREGLQAVPVYTCLRLIKSCPTDNSVFSMM